MINENFNDNNEKELVEEISSDEVGERVDEIITDESLPPRKRKIIKNYQLPVTISIVLIAFLTVIIWNMFFNKSIIGSWYFIKEGSYTETFDEPTATPDGVGERTTDYSQRVCYEFTDEGRCIVTLGTTAIEGTYTLYTSEDNRILSAYVANNYSVLMYGNYSYEIKGNIFTGRELIITDMTTGEVLNLETGEGENPLEPFQNAQLDERFVGKWRDEDFGLTYEFTDDGYMTLFTDDGMIVEHVYTIVEDGVMLVKYYGSEEFSYSYVYSFDDDGKLTFNDSLLKQIG